MRAEATADMRVDLDWEYDMGRHAISHFNIHRDADPTCRPELINCLGQAPAKRFIDMPRLHHGGWIRKTLEPDTVYHYRIVPVDRYNNMGPPSEPIEARTPRPEQENLVPLKVEGLRAVLVSPIMSFNVVNMIFRTPRE